MASYFLNKEIDISGNYDIVVAGAGTAGICAAVSAAEQHCKVAVVERYGTIGGNLTLGHVGPIMGEVSPGTMGDKIQRLLCGNRCDIQHDPENAKIVLSNLMHENKIDVYTGCQVTEVMKSGNRVTGVIIATSAGVKALTSSVTIDATGDGTVAFLAGAPFKMGRDKDFLMQPASIMFTVSGVDPHQKLVCMHEEDDTELPCGNYLQMCKDACKLGELPENVNIVRLYRTEHSDERIVNATQVNYVNGLHPLETSAAEYRLRQQTVQILRFLRKIPGFENCRLRASSDFSGIRETRRIIGDYVLSGNDLLKGKKFFDRIVHNANFCIDIHNPDGAGQSETVGRPLNAQPYDIPYRCFVPLEIDGIYTCGRCISGTHTAHASYRVMKICMAMGEAVGIAASLCVQEHTIPRELNYKKVQEILIDKGIKLFD